MIGQTVGKYRVEERIGRGGMGTVYRAVDEMLRRDVAIKVLNSELNDPEVAKRFKAEAITVARLNHAGIATVYELFEHEGQWLMVMEFVRGETLERLIERAGPLSAERAADLTIQALAALAHAHALGVVHRDLKPANLMLTEGGAVKIMDFGIARVTGSEHLTNAGFMMGTPAYMAPEQVLGHEVDARTDVYAMGVVLYRLTSGKLPFRGDTPFALAQSQVNDPPTPIHIAREGLPPWLELVLDKALAKAPSGRFQTAFEFREVLKRSLAGVPLDALLDFDSPATFMLTPTGLPSGTYGTPARSGPVPVPGPSGAVSMTAGSQSPGMPTSGPVPTQMLSPMTAETMRAASGALPAQPASSSVQMTSANPVPSSTASLSASPSGALAPDAATMMAGTGAVNQPPVVPVKAKPPAKTKLPLPAIAGGVVVIVVVGYLMLKPSAPAPVAPSTTSAPSTTPNPTDPAAPPATTPPATDPATTAAPPTPPVSGAANPTSTGDTKPPATPTSGDARGATPPSSASTAATTSAAGSRAGAPGTTPADAGRGSGRADARGPATDDALIIFSDAKLLTFQGRKGKDQDVIIHFGSGQISIVPKKGGAALVMLPYRKVVRATYSHTKDPKWDDALPGLPENPDIPGFMRGTRHWLMLQSKTDYTIVFLDDTNWSKVIETFEVRTGLKVDRPADGK